MAKHPVTTQNGSVLCYVDTEVGALRMQQMCRARLRFSMRYAKERGWGDSLDELSIDQLLEIRQQPGWLTPDLELN